MIPLTKDNRMNSMKTLIKSLAAISLTIGVSLLAADKTFIDYFQPTPIIGSLTTNTWGAPAFYRAIRRTAWKIQA